MGIDFITLPQVLEGKLLSYNPNFRIDYIITDSRSVIFDKNTVFIAINGVRHDGHSYIKSLYDTGVRQFIVENTLYVSEDYADASFFLVSNSIIALQRLAEYKRSKFTKDVIAITGSNGKTIIKEWLFSLLNKDYIIAKSPKSYNSQIGVPLSVFQLENYHTLGIFEAGISQKGEMQKLQAIIKPTIGIFTNIGNAHDEGFENIAQKVAEKMILFIGINKLIYCIDYEQIHAQVIERNINSVSWSFKGNKLARYCINRKENTFFEIVDTVTNEKRVFEYPFYDKASIENLTHCIVLMLELGYTEDLIKSRIALLDAVPMRLEVKDGINKSFIIDDSYNNDLAGLGIAIDFMNTQYQTKGRVLILSDMLETGIAGDKLYTQINQMIEKSNIELFVGIGPQLSNYRHLFTTTKSLFFESTESFLFQFNELLYQDKLILVKGSRIFEFEKIVNRLQKKNHRTVLEIDLEALVHNLNFYKARLQKGTKVMAMVKSFAYGSGSIEVAQLLQSRHVDYLGVAYCDEAVVLRKGGIHLPIMVMSATIDDIETLVKYRLEPVLFSIEMIKEFEKELIKRDDVLSVHLELETGMHRLGVEQEDLEEAVAIFEKSKNIKIASVFTHLAGADGADFKEFTQKQYDLYQKGLQKIESKICYPILKHILNSAGIVRYPQYQLDMVRLGIGLYGIEANAMYQHELQNVSTLKAKIKQIKKVSESDTIGYSRKGKLKKDGKIAVISIGYGDGLHRALSNGVGYVSVNGQKAKIVGNICMDMTMIDITEIDAKVGDEVIVFGKENSVIDLSKEINTIPYELLTAVGDRVRRVYYWS
jgi:alanine racemase